MSAVLQQARAEQRGGRGILDCGEILQLVATSDVFRPDFAEYLQENFHVWLRFRQEADKLRAAGWSHYSGRTIVEVLRHESNLREAGGRWKLNDWWTPDLCRLYLAVTPGSAGFFELRGRA